MTADDLHPLLDLLRPFYPDVLPAAVAFRRADPGDQATLDRLMPSTHASPQRVAHWVGVPGLPFVGLAGDEDTALYALRALLERECTRCGLALPLRRASKGAP